MRVLSLLPSATEILFAIGAADHLVGVTHECDWPPAARLKPQLTSARITPDIASADIDRLVREQLDDTGTLYALDMDLVRELQPDLVLTQQLCTVCAVGFETVRSAMNSLPTPPEVVNVEPHTLEDVFDSFVEIGQRTGCEQSARMLVQTSRERLDRLCLIQDATEVAPDAIPLHTHFEGASSSSDGRTPSRSAAADDRDRDRLLFLEWIDPPFCAGHWIPELISAAGFEPILSNPGKPSQQLSWHEIYSVSFDVLFISCCGFSIERTLHDVETSAAISELINRNPNVRVCIADGNHYFSRPGPRLIDSAEILACL